MLFDKTTIELFKNVINRDGYLDLPAIGNSMYPLIKQGDLCRFVPCKPVELKKGDVVLYYSAAGQIIAHRFIERRTIKFIDYFYLKGDTNLSFDIPVDGSQILGKMIIIKKRDKMISSKGFPVAIWGRLITITPFISNLLRKYLSWKAHYQS